jgi:nitrite reductase/ring-hydroxylating ferredoxin subunit
MIIPSKFYSNNYSFKNELDNIFFDNWLFFGFKTEFEENSIVSKKIAGAPIFIVKSNLTYKGYFNVCPHRGATLVNNSNYIGTKKNVFCPYHSWGFDLETGKSINVKSDDLFNKECSDLKCVEVDSIGNFLFVKFSSNSTVSLYEYLGNPIVDELLVATEVLDFNKINSKSISHLCNWKHIVENVIDNKHCSPVHKDTLAKIGFCKNKPITQLYNLHSEFIIQPGSTDDVLKRRKLLKRLYNEDILSDNYKHILVFPNLTISIFEGVHYTVGFINPLSNLETSYETHYIRPLIMDENISNAIEESHVTTALDIFAEDVVMLNSLSDNLELIGFRGELYNDEFRIKHFMNNYLSQINK